MDRLSKDAERKIRSLMTRIVDILTEELVSGIRAVLPAQPGDRRTHVDRVYDALRGGAAMTVAELSEATGISNGAVRLVLYTKNGTLFDCESVSGYRKKWKARAVTSA